MPYRKIISIANVYHPRQILRVQAAICTYDAYSFPTVRKDLTLRLQFRFFNMNHRKPALIQWKVATPAVLVDRQQSEPRLSPPRGKLNCKRYFYSFTNTVSPDKLPRAKYTRKRSRWCARWNSGNVAGELRVACFGARLISRGMSRKHRVRKQRKKKYGMGSLFIWDCV